jgi:hypothetical protein
MIGVNEQENIAASYRWIRAPNPALQSDPRLVALHKIAGILARGSDLSL